MKNNFFYDIHKSILIDLKNDLFNKLFDKYDSYKLLLNRFPYPLKNGKHYILWFNPKYNWIENEKLVNLLLKKFFDKKEVKIWENADFLRTVKHIRHIHIIVKN